MTRATRLVLVSCPRRKASALAAILVKSRVAACVNIVPSVQSVYRWQGKLQMDDEALLVIKTAADRFEDLKKTVLKNHPYELPEVIAVKLAGGHKPYLDWVLDSTR